MKLILALIILFLYSGAILFYPSDTQSVVQFRIKNFGASVEGSFKGLKGTIQFDSKSPEQCKINLSLTVSTIDTGINLRNNHLKKVEYFDVANYPLLSFESSKISRQGNQWMVTGKLKIKTTVKEITFPFKVIQEKDGIRFMGEFKIDRTDYGVGGNSFSMSDDVTVSFNLLGLEKP